MIHWSQVCGLLINAHCHYDGNRNKGISGHKNINVGKNVDLKRAIEYKTQEEIYRNINYVQDNVGISGTL